MHGPRQHNSARRGRPHAQRHLRRHRLAGPAAAGARVRAGGRHGHRPRVLFHAPPARRALLPPGQCAVPGASGRGRRQPSCDRHRARPQARGVGHGGGAGGRAAPLCGLGRLLHDPPRPAQNLSGALHGPVRPHPALRRRGPHAMVAHRRRWRRPARSTAPMWSWSLRSSPCFGRASTTGASSPAFRRLWRAPTPPQARGRARQSGTATPRPRGRMRGS